jgi:hypothetical protein
VLCEVNLHGAISTLTVEAMRAKVGAPKLLCVRKEWSTKASARGSKTLEKNSDQNNQQDQSTNSDIHCSSPPAVLVARS